MGLIRGVLADLIGQPVPPVPGWRADWADAPGRPLFAAASRHLVPVAHPPRPGDVIAFRIAGREAHVGILSPGDRVIHAAKTVGVVEVPLAAWRGRISFRACFPGAPSGPAIPAA
ncbi:peptidase [Paracoccus sp. (in: a-proteobacteria)]|uniref:peptidase n=1 Tax=Paracoccus sp. TaxID=267 RepID=UPI003A8B166D